MVIWILQNPATLHKIRFSFTVSQIPFPKYSDGVRREQERGRILPLTLFRILSLTRIRIIGMW